MACTHEATLTMAGARGIGALVLGFSGPDEIARKNTFNREAFATLKSENQGGFRPTEHLAALCAATVLEDREKARETGFRGGSACSLNGSPPSIRADPSRRSTRTSPLNSNWQSSSMRSKRSSPICPRNTSRSATSKLRTTLSRRKPYGYPEDCIREAQRLFDSGADEILFLFQMGGISIEAIMEKIRNIGEKVIQHFPGMKQAKATE